MSRALLASIEQRAADFKYLYRSWSLEHRVGYETKDEEAVDACKRKERRQIDALM